MKNLDEFEYVINRHGEEEFLFSSEEHLKEIVLEILEKHIRKNKKEIIEKVIAENIYEERILDEKNQLLKNIVGISYFAIYNRHDERLEIYKKKLIKNYLFLKENGEIFNNINNGKELQKKMLMDMWIGDYCGYISDIEIKYILWSQFNDENRDIKFEPNNILKCRYMEITFDIINLICSSSCDEDFLKYIEKI
jgi:hypothetical protein